MLQRFIQAAEAVGTVVSRHQNLDDAIGHLAGLAAGSPLSRSPLSAAITALLAQRTDLVAGVPPDADICLSQARAGIADTGTLLLDVTDPAGRSATALPRRHAVVLFARDLVPDLAAIAPLLAESLAGHGPAFLSLTTGPSRTADIERVLTIGVHGAKELHLLIIDGEAP